MSSGKGDKSKRERTRKKGDASDVTTEAMTDDIMLSVPMKGRQYQLDSSSSEVDEADLGKRFKPASPKSMKGGGEVAAKAGGDAGGAKSAGASSGKAAKVGGRAARPRKMATALVEAEGWVGQVKSITEDLMEVVFGKLDADLPKKVLTQGGRYEALLMKLVAENERLKGRLDVLDGGSFGSGVGAARVQAMRLAPAVPVAAAVPALTAVPAVPVTKPVETWSVMVKGKGGATSKEIVEKVEKVVGPTLGVRVHDIRPMRDGGAVIRTPSVAERQKIAANSKFAEVGLEVAVRDKLGPRVVVQRVHAEISTDEFMGDLYGMNLKETMSQESFAKSVRLVSSPWKSANDHVNVVLECTGKVAEKLCGEGVYVKWFRFAARLQDAIPACHRCLSFDHRVRECRMTQDVCRHCGLTGHIAARCPNAMRCRNCALKGFPADHMMMSPACPVYTALTARANSRH